MQFVFSVTIFPLTLRHQSKVRLYAFLTELCLSNSLKTPIFCLRKSEYTYIAQCAPALHRFRLSPACLQASSALCQCHLTPSAECGAAGHQLTRQHQADLCNICHLPSPDKPILSSTQPSGAQ